MIGDDDTYLQSVLSVNASAAIRVIYVLVPPILMRIAD